MAIVRTAGTEIIRSVCMQDVDGTQELIVGVQHHIYTVLSIILECQAKQAVTNKFKFYLQAWDAHAGSSGETVYIVDSKIQVGETYVWGDKFSFNGYEPTGISGSMNTAAEQDAIADQEGSAVQKLIFTCDNPADNYDIICTYIDQNNA